MFCNPASNQVPVHVLWHEKRGRATKPGKKHEATMASTSSPLLWNFDRKRMPSIGQDETAICSRPDATS